MIDPAYPNLAKVVALQIAAFPEHQAYLTKRFATASPEQMRLVEDLATLILKVAGDEIETCCADYRWLTGVMLEEEMFFRREGRYRLSTFQEALDNVYNNQEFMTRYMNGLLVSQLWWKNHTDVLGFFRNTFLPGNPDGYSFLEIGPGHGLSLFMAASDPRCASAEGWDVSAASLLGTRKALDAMEIKRPIALTQVDIFDAPDRQYQAIMLSCVLEHLEQPREALAILRRLLAPGGRLFVSAPANSPMPDHLQLFHAPEEVVEIIREAGFGIENTLFAPLTGSSLERARKLKLAISNAVIATR